MTPLKRIPTLLAVIALAAATTLAVVGDADARRGGSFGSRGARTYQAPAATQTAPRPAQPIERSMTQPSAQTPSAATAAQAQPGRKGLFGGFAGSMLGGLALGGLIGMLLGNGFGGLAGAFGFILQIALLAIGGMLLMRFLANRRQPAAAGAGQAPNAGGMFRSGLGNAGPGAPGNGGVGGGLGGGLGSALGGFGGGAAAPRPKNAMNDQDEIGIGQDDLETFERLLDEIQGAYGREDYAAIRARTTPEIMSYLAEELSGNATSGVRNEVSDVKLLQGDLAEAWREGNADYATVAMRYESRDVMRDRATGAVVSGDPDKATETTEIWTFTRPVGGEWKLSAIQEA